MRNQKLPAQRRPLMASFRLWPLHHWLTTHETSQTKGVSGLGLRLQLRWPLRPHKQIGSGVWFGVRISVAVFLVGTSQRVRC